MTQYTGIGHQDPDAGSIEDGRVEQSETDATHEKATKQSESAGLTLGKTTCAQKLHGAGWLSLSIQWLLTLLPLLFIGSYVLDSLKHLPSVALLSALSTITLC